jgi:hypothetical protein
MATDTTRGSTKVSEQTETKTTVSGPEGQATYRTQSSEQQLLDSPVYFDRRKKKDKRRRRYSKGTKPWQKLLLGASRAAYRTANSFARGFDTFAKRSNRSARRRRDGLVRDSLRNAARGFNDASREVGKAPWAVARQIGTKNVRRGFRIVFNPFSLGS